MSTHQHSRALGVSSARSGCHRARQGRQAGLVREGWGAGKDGQALCSSPGASESVCKKASGPEDANLNTLKEEMASYGSRPGPQLSNQHQRQLL